MTLGTAEEVQPLPAFPRSRVPGFDLRTLSLTTAAHFLNDLHYAFLAPLLPLVVVKFNLSLTLAGLLATILNSSSALSQPVFGAFADQMQRRIFVVLGPTLTIVAMALVGLVPSYEALIVVLLIAGTGTSSFHPQAASTAGYASGPRKGTGLSLFVAGGEFGFALGPLWIALVVSTLGLRATWVAALPGLAACAVLWTQVRSQPTAHAARERSLRQDLRGVIRPLGLLWLLVALRNIIILSFITFLPLLLRERGGTLLAGGAAVFFFGGVGAIGGLLGGALSDRLGRRAVLVLSMAIGTPLLYAFLHLRGPWGFVLLALGGVSYYLTAAVTIVMAQQIMPHRASVASSIVMGLAWGSGGLALTGVGALADAVSLQTALTYVLALVVPALLVVAVLPSVATEPTGTRERGNTGTP
ncbi:MAG TPA: MFS transporter [bacterium]|nr:MFS transporter [bacterium]